MLSDRNKLGEAILSLMQTYENESRSAQSMQRIRKLENAISDLAFSLYDRTVRARVHMFGSRVTGLATDKSDVDIYLQLGTLMRNPYRFHSRVVFFSVCSYFLKQYFFFYR